jgi:hypothetical protein
VKIDGDPSPPMKTTNFPDYPPLRSKQEAEQVKLKSLERYGGERRSDDDDMKLHIDGITDPSVDGEADGEPLLDAVVDATYIATTYESHQQDTSVEYVDPDRIEQVLEALGREVDNIHQFMENNGNIFGTQILVGDATRFGLKEKGKAMSQQLDSGSSGSAGKTNHRAMLKEARDELAKLGIAMTIPSQGGDEEEPDGIGHPFAVDEKAPAGELMHDTDNSTVLIEAESTTSTSRPAQMLNNLRKAYDQDEKCVFLVRNGKNNRPFEWGATNIATKISDEPLLASKQRDGEAKYYNLQRGAPPHLHKPTSKKDKGIVLRPKLDSERRPESRWWKTADGRIVLRDGEGTVNAEFASIRAFENWELDDFPAHFVETVDGSYSVTVDGSFHEEYDSISALKDDWVRIREPYVPEIEFDGDLPTTDDYSVIILPDDSVESPPQLYAGAEQYHSLYSYESEPANPEQAAVEGLTENDGEQTESDEDTEEPGRNRFV